MDARVDLRVRGPVSLYVAAENLFDVNVETAITGTGERSFATPQFFRVGLTYRR